MKEYLRLLRFVRPQTAPLTVAFFCMVISAIFDGVQLSMIVPLADKVFGKGLIILPKEAPGFITSFIERLNSIPAPRMLNLLTVCIVILFFLKCLFTFLQGYLMSDIGQRVVRDIRTLLYEKLQSLSLDYFSQKRSGELVSRVTNDVRNLENAVSYSLTDMVYGCLKIFIFLGIIFFIHGKLALVSFVILPLIVAPLLLIGRALRKLSHRLQEKMADINSLLYETITGIRIVKAFSMQGYEINKFRQQNQQFYKIIMKITKRALFLDPMSEFIAALGGATVCYVAGREVIQGRLSFGVFALFLGSLFSLIRPFKKLAGAYSINQQALASVSRIYEVLEARVSVEEAPQPLSLPGLKDRIVFEDAWFRYDQEDEWVLQEINLEIKKGQIIALVGPTGCGKTTLTNLLARFYDPQKGRVLFDAMDIRQVRIKDLISLIGLVTQETVLFNDTVRANIAYGNLNAGEKAIQEAARRAFAHEFIMRLPQGYETFIGDRGMKLSGGQRQRIAIARAILKDPPILILDEATSQLDTQAERVVQEAIEELMKGRTVFVIAHRLSTIKGADKIVVMEAGRIVDQGRHEDLISKFGLYRSLYELQGL